MRYDRERAEEADSPLRWHSRNQIKMKAGLHGERRVANRTLAPKVRRVQRDPDHSQIPDLKYSLTTSDGSSIYITTEEAAMATKAGYEPKSLYYNPKENSAA